MATKRLVSIMVITIGLLTYVGQSHLTALLQRLSPQKVQLTKPSMLSGKPQLSAVQLLNVLLKFKNKIYNTERELVNSVPAVKPMKIQHQTLTTLDAFSEDYLGRFKDVDNVKTAVFTVERSVFASIISPRLYDIHSSTCDLLKNKSIYQDVGDLKCTADSTYGYVDTQTDIKSQIISDHYYWTKALKGLHDKSHNSPMIELGYVQVVHDAYITDCGDFITGNNHILLVRCGRKYPGRLKNPNATRLYDKVFSISQFWGFGYFHFLVEDLPRLALALPFLQANKDVKVHVSSKSSFIKAFTNDLGITEDRLVSGTVHSKVAYIPGGTSCGSAAISTINALSILLRSKVEKNIHRDAIILIKRSAKRWFSHHDAILKMLQSAGMTYNLTVHVFGDRPSPSLYVTRRLFSRAVLVVAPHGAGLSNLVFSPPGVCVVEGLCYENGKVNPCYKRLSQVLGHIYHGVVPRKQCMQIKAAELQPHVHQCLKYVTQ